MLNHQITKWPNQKMSLQNHLQERLADQIRIELEELIAGELKDPRIGLATVARVELSPDLSHCRVFVSVEGDAAAEQETLAGLSSSAGFARRELSQRLRLKRAPEVVFALDRGEHNNERVDRILKDMKQDQELGD